MKAHLLSDKSVKQIEIVKVKDNISFHYTDDVSVEEPLEIRVSYYSADKKESKNISVTMRTPEMMKNWRLVFYLQKEL
jgi:FdhD protein